MFAQGIQAQRGRDSNNDLKQPKVCFEMIINYVSTMVFVQREWREQLVEEEMTDAPKHCIQLHSIKKHFR